LKAHEVELKPIFCIGETLQEREDGKLEDVLRTQVTEGLKNVSEKQMLDTVIAYEPVWAIGTGVVATPKQAQDTHEFVRSVLTDLYGVSVSEKVRIQYGGSVKGENSAELLGQKDIDGALGNIYYLTTSNHIMERAVFGTRSGEVLVGYGPFTAFAEPPSAGVAFYRNDFSLSEEKPWLVPSRVEVLEKLPAGRPVEIAWEEPDPAGFAEVFREVSAAIGQGVLEKSVPVVTAKGKGKCSPDDLLASLVNVPKTLRPYGWIGEDGGFLGAREVIGSGNGDSE